MNINHEQITHKNFVFQKFSALLTLYALVANKFTDTGC